MKTNIFFKLFQPVFSLKLVEKVLSIVIISIPIQAIDAQTKPQENFYEIKARWEKKISDAKDKTDENGKTDDELEDGINAKFNRWYHLWRYRIGPNGEMDAGRAAMYKYQKELADVNRHGSRMSSCDSPNDNDVNWINLGPFNSSGGLGQAASGGGNYCSGFLPNKQNQGRVDAISIDPTNSNNILLGAYNGGIWRTTNGGSTWANTTDDEGYSLYSFMAFVRHPANPNYIYASSRVSGGTWEGKRDIYGMGVVFSSDGGVTWTPTGMYYDPTNPSTNWNTQLGELAIDPTSTISNTKLYVVSNTDIWHWQGNSSASGAWTSLYTDASWHQGPLWYDYSNFNDIEVTSSGIVFFCNFKGLYKYQNGTVTQVTSYSIPAPYNSTTACGPSNQVLRSHMNIEINAQGHIVLLIAFTNCNNPQKLFIYKSTDNGSTWSIPKDVSSNVHHNDSDKFPMLAVSPSNSDIIYTQYDSYYRCANKSTNFGVSFSLMGNSHNHVDIRNIVPYSNTGSIVYLLTDGGVSKTTNGQDWVDISGQGLSITNFYGCGITESNDKIIFAGAQDGSINYFNNGQWYETDPCCDNGDCLIDPNNSNLIFQEYQYNLTKGLLVGNNVPSNSSYSYSNTGIGFMNPLKWNGSSSNEFFYGDNFLKVGLSTGTTLTTISTTLHGSDKNISSVEVSRNNPNVVYYSTDDFPNGGIYKATRSGSTWTVTEISNNLKSSSGIVAPITDIAVDPNDENRIWITLGRFYSNHKVYYSANGGSFWQNLTTTCLPNFPATSIVFQEMSNDRIYIGTDNGVYYKDNNTDWAKYGNNGPQCMVNDMEINQCAGKLVVATHGRGLWEAPLILSPEATIVTGTVTWNKSRTVANNIFIPTGATLNITGAGTVINMAQNTKIMIAQGGRLNVTDAKLTNNCNYNWYGIDVWGNSNLSQTYVNQGVLILNNATIEHATEAINVSKDGGILYNGGIIQATNTKFFNNKRSVAYYKYDFQNNIGFFTNCNFKTDANYRHSLSLLAHFTMWAVKGVNIYGCNFETTNNFAWNASRVHGIGTYDATFTVTDYCAAGTNPCPGAIKSTFKGLHKAINAFSANGTYTFNVYNSIFQDNVYGIITSGHNFFNIRANNFTVGKSSVGNTVVHEGISIFAGMGFNVDQNIFTPTFTSSSQPTTIGIRCTDTGSSDNEIYKNSFYKSGPGNNNIFYADLANGTNRNSGTPIFGLKYYCNTNTNNTLLGYDFAVTDAGISNAQGSLNFPARNTFSLGTSVPNSDFNNGASTGFINYYHRNISNETPVNKFQLNNFLTSGAENSCFDRYGGVLFFTLPDEENYNKIIANIINLNSNLDEARHKEDQSLVQNLEQELLDLHREKFSFERDVLQFFIHTVSESNDTKLVEWYRKINDEHAKMSLIDLFISKYDISNAQSEIETFLQYIANLVDKDDQLLNFINLKTLQIKALNEGREIMTSLNAEEKAFMEKLAKKDRGVVGYQARSILNFHGGNYFIDPVFPTNIELRGAKSNELESNLAIISVQPNPANSFVSFKYDMKESKIENTKLKIVDFLGRPIQEFFVFNPTGEIIWDCSFTPSGIYYYTITNNNQAILISKPVIIIK